MEIKRIAPIAVLLLVAATARAPLSGAADIGASADWPEHHGPGRTNISPDKGLLKEWPQGGPGKLWTYSPCGRGFSGVTIADGMAELLPV
jgi:hypothetical protein